jgi:uncharacterized Zn-finger protein
MEEKQKFKCGWCSVVYDDDEKAGKDDDGVVICCYCRDKAVDEKFKEAENYGYY